MPAVKVGEPYYVVDGTKYTQSALSKKSLQEQTLIKLAAQEQATPTAAAVHAKLYGGTAGAALKSSQFWESYSKNVMDLTEEYKQARAAGDLSRAKSLWESGMSKYSVDVHREMSIPAGTTVEYPAGFWGPAKAEAPPPGPTRELAASVFPPPRGVKLQVDPSARGEVSPFRYQQDVTVPPPPTPFGPAVPGGAFMGGPVYDASSVKYLKAFEEEMRRTPQEDLEYRMAYAKGRSSELLQARYEEIRSRIAAASKETPISIELDQRERRFGVTTHAENIPLYVAAFLGSAAIGGKEGFIDPTIGLVQDPVGTGEMVLAGGYGAITDPVGFLTEISAFAMEKTGEYGPGYLPGFALGMYAQGKLYSKGASLAVGGMRSIAHMPYYLEGPWKPGATHYLQKVKSRFVRAPKPSTVEIPFKEGTSARGIYDAFSKRFKATTGGSVSSEMLTGKKLPRHAFKFSKDLDVLFQSADDMAAAREYALAHGARPGPGGAGLFVKYKGKWVHWDMHVEPGHAFTTVGGRRLLSYREQLFRKGPKTMLDPGEFGRGALETPPYDVRTTWADFKKLRAAGKMDKTLYYAKDPMDFMYLMDEMFKPHISSVDDLLKVIKYKKRIGFKWSGEFNPSTSLDDAITVYSGGKKTLLHEYTHAITEKALRRISAQQVNKDFSKLLIKKHGRARAIEIANNLKREFREYYTQGEWKSELIANMGEQFPDEILNPTTKTGRILHKRYIATQETGILKGMKPIDYSSILKPEWLESYTVKPMDIKGVTRVALIPRVGKAGRAARLASRAERAARVSAEASQVVDSVAPVASAVSSSMGVVMSSLSVLGGGSRPSRPPKVSRAPSRPSKSRVSKSDIPSYIIPPSILPPSYPGYPPSGPPSPPRKSPPSKGPPSYPGFPPSSPPSPPKKSPPSRGPPSPPSPPTRAPPGYPPYFPPEIPGFPGPPPRAPPRKIDEEKEKKRRARKDDRGREYEYRASIWGWLTGEEVEDEPSPLYWTGFSSRPVVKRKGRKR